MAVKRMGVQPVPKLRQIMLGLTSASLLFTTTLTPLAAQGVAPGAPPGVVAGPTGSVYSAEELDAILAPIALYPDQLLSQLLMATAFPDQVTEAARWARSLGNRALRGEALDWALRPIPWDPAVKSLVPFPQALDMLASHAEWMAQLAYAVATQEAATFDAIQRLRRQAWLAGQLRSTAQQLVRMDGDLIVIEPAAPNLVYVPVYNPRVIYGAWPYPAYPPYYFPPSYYVPGDVLASGIFFGAGVLVAGALWGWATPRWRDRHFFIDRDRYEYFRHFHRAPSGDWGRWDRDQWRPPPRPLDGQVRPPPPRPGDGQFRPQAPRPGDGQFRPQAPRPSERELRPQAPRPSDGQVRPEAPRPSEHELRPQAPRPSNGQVRPSPRQEGGEQFRAPPAGGGAVGRPAPPAEGRREPERQRREN